MAQPPKTLERRHDCVRHMPCCDSENDIILFSQGRQQISGAAERHLRVGIIGPKQWEPSLIGGDHFFDGRIRSSQSRKHKFQGDSNQRQTFILGWSGKSEFVENNPVRFNNHSPAVDERAVEVENNQLGRAFLTRG